MPVILHVNTVRYEDELSRLLAAYRSSRWCARTCGARTSVDRLERLLAAHPGLRFDTSGGARSTRRPGSPASSRRALASARCCGLTPSGSCSART
ncbi:hypothetical protein OV079_52575 [Nannocystis pusilla]|uniref:Uncharacterized protein n=1 Tax=Nannocystis pusilla TaxID=889268 RepID=A0A9X3J2P4_9BACT|nr:hypothetical protein [Nannocystis pusilla]MCY1014022.1 hypothetical protein [Nannocystis pusilla]